MPSRSRRALLKTVGIVAAGLAGCQASRDGRPTNAPNRSPSPTPGPSTPVTQAGPPGESSADGSSPVPGHTETDWPLAQHDATHTSYTGEGAPFAEAPAERWSVQSTVPSDIDALGAALSQPVVVDEHLYVVNRVEVGTQRADPGGHTLQARDATTGELQWTFRLPERPPTPAVSGSDVLIHSEDTLYALDRFDGTKRWTRTVNGFGRVVPTTDRIYVWGKAFHALSPDGETVWERSFERSVAVPPAIDAGVVYEALVGGRVVALDAETGETRWTGDTPRGGAETEALSPNVSTVVATGDEVLVVTDGDIHAFGTGGAVRWVREGYAWHLTTDGTTLYYRDRIPDPYRTVLRARDVETGELTWVHPYEIRSLSHGVLTDGLLFMPAADELLAIDPDDGRRLWGTTPALDSLALADGALYGISPDDESLVSMT